MLFNKKFNRIISIGEDCACAGWLKKKNLRTASYPFDWLTGASFRTRVELILSDFTGFLTRNNMRRLEKPTSGRFDMKNDSYEDTSFGFFFYHDFPSGKSLDESYVDVKAKYMRRIDRLLTDLRTKKKILLVWWSRDKHLMDDECLWAQEAISQKFGEPIHFLFIEDETGKEIHERFISQYVCRVSGPITIPETGGEEVTMGNLIVNNSIFSKIERELSFSERTFRLQRLFAHILCGFIPFKKLRRAIRKKLLAQ